MTPEERETTKKLIENLTEMIDLQHQQIQQEKQMRRIMYLCLLLDRAPKEMREANVGSHVIEGANPRLPWKCAKFVVTVDGKEFKFPIMDVSRELWPEDMLASYNRWRVVGKK